jgi:hypothetical protein
MVNRSSRLIVQDIRDTLLVDVESESFAKDKAQFELQDLGTTALLALPQTSPSFFNATHVPGVVMNVALWSLSHV